MANVARRWCWRLGVEPRGLEADTQLVAACEAAMREGQAQPDAFFFRHRGGRGGADGALGESLADYTPLALSHDYWADETPQAMLIDEVEAIWAAIDAHDDWSPLHAKVTLLRRMGAAHGPPPVPAGHDEARF
jgi:hypothetical protein